ncbi:MAG: Calx-beta domain-containing protein [Myxococcota bacterium]
MRVLTALAALSLLLCGCGADSQVDPISDDRPDTSSAPDETPAPGPNPAPIVPTLSFETLAQRVVESDNIVQLRVTLSDAVQEQVSVDYAVTGGSAAGDGNDFSLAPGTASVDPNDLSATIDLILVDDLTSEPDETVEITLSNPVGAALSSTARVLVVTIADDESNPSVAFVSTEITRPESVGSESLTVRLDRAASTTVTVDYAVTGGSADSADHGVRSGTLTFEPGVTEREIAVPITDDLEDENSESFTITLSSPSNAILGQRSSLAFTIVDNDGPPCPSGVPSGSTYFIEENALLVVETESIAEGTNWQRRQRAGNTGTHYLYWNGGNQSCGQGPERGPMTYLLEIVTAGTYRFQWRSYNPNTNNTENNDAWLRFADADDFFALDNYPDGTNHGGNGTVRPDPNSSQGRRFESNGHPQGWCASQNGWFKVYQNKTRQWTFDTFTSDENRHDIYVRFDSAGFYTMELAGRSQDFGIDRFVLYQEGSHSTSSATSSNASDVVNCQ